jgi:hypothetical protein
MNRYAIEHPRTATITVADIQRAADYLFSFRNSPDFEIYVVRDLRDGHVYSVKAGETCCGIEMTHDGCRA